MLWMVLLSGLAGSGSALQANELAQPHESRSVIRITDVLHRSQQMRLDGLSVAAMGTPDAVVVQLSFQRLVRALGPTGHVELRVVPAETIV